MITVLMIHRQLGFAVAFKQALERAGAYQVHPFTEASAALDYLRDTPQDVLLIDFGVHDASGVVREARAIQAGIAVIASPRPPHDLVNTLNLQGTLDARFTARDVIGILNTLPGITPDVPRGKTVPLDPANLPELPPTRQAKSAQDTSMTDMLKSSDAEEKPKMPRREPDQPRKPLTARQEKFVEFIFNDGMDSVLDEIDSGTRGAPVRPENVPPPTPPASTLRSRMPPKPNDLPETDRIVPPDQKPDQQFAQLAQDEPPPPTFEESGTVSDLVTGVSARSFSNVLSLLRGEEVEDTGESDAESNAESNADIVERFSEEDLRDAFGVDDDEDSVTFGTLYPAAPQNYDFGDESAEVELPPPSTPLTESQSNLERYLSSLKVDIPNVENLDSQVRGKPSSQRFPFEALPAFDDEGDGSGNTARIVLGAVGDTTNLDTFSISQLIASIESQLPENRPKVQALPSWIEENEVRAADIARYVEEPDFLPPTLPEAELLPDVPPATLPEPLSTDKFSDQATRVSQGQRLEAETMDDATEWLQPTSEVFPDAPWLEPVSERPSEQFAPVVDESAPIADEFPPEEAIREGDTAPVMPITGIESPDRAFALNEPITDPYIAQLALSLTQVSLELTAEAALLARYGRIVAYAGTMDRVDMDELRQAINDDWEAQPRQARIRLVTLEGSGKEYMLYSKLTDDDLTLSLIFAGTTPLRDIRRQGKRLIDALQEVPEVGFNTPIFPPEHASETSSYPSPTPTAEAWESPTRDTPLDLPTEEALTPEERAVIQASISAQDNDTPMTAYAMVWLVRDTSAALDTATASAIVSGMRVQLIERAWQIQDLQAKSDYIYLLATVPGDLPPYDIVRDLKRRSAEIAARQNPALKPETLWGDGYLVVTPGRQLEMDEIQQFISFERM